MYLSSASVYVQGESVQDAAFRLFLFGKDIFLSFFSSSLELDVCVCVSTQCESNWSNSSVRSVLQDMGTNASGKIRHVSETCCFQTLHAEYNVNIGAGSVSFKLNHF